MTATDTTPHTGSVPTPPAAPDVDPAGMRVVWLLLIAAFVAILNETTMSIAIPHLNVDLGVPPEQLTLEHYRLLLAPYAAGVVELMVHPAYVDAALMSKTAITGTSDAEQRLLMDPGFTSMTAALGYRLGTFRDLAQGRH